MRKIILVGFALFVCGLLYNLKTGETKRKLSISFENVHSKDTLEGLRIFINAYKGLDDTKEFYKRLKASFKMVKRIEWDFTDPSLIRLKVYGVRPLWEINDNLILGDKKRLFPLEVFKDFDRSVLKKITIDQEHCGDKIKGSLHQFLQSIPPDLLTRYNVIYKSKREILLQGKGYMILADEVSIFDEQKLNRVETIKDHGNFFDVRFKNRIIAKSRRKIRG